MNPYGLPNARTHWPCRQRSLSPNSAVALAARVKRAGKEFIGDQHELYLIDERAEEDTGAADVALDPRGQVMVLARSLTRATRRMMRATAIRI